MCCTVLEQGQALGCPQATTGGYTSLQGCAGVQIMGCAWVQHWPVTESQPAAPGWDKGTRHWQELSACFLSGTGTQSLAGEHSTPVPTRWAEEITLRHQGKMFKLPLLSPKSPLGAPSRERRLGPGTACDARKEQM